MVMTYIVTTIVKAAKLATLHIVLIVLLYVATRYVIITSYSHYIFILFWKKSSRLAIFKLILEKFRRVFHVTTIAMEIR